MVFYVLVNFEKKQICIVCKNYMDDTFSVDMFSPSLDQFVLILTPDMQKTNVLSGSEKLVQKISPKMSKNAEPCLKFAQNT